MADNKGELRFRIEGMDCPGCAVNIESGLNGGKGIHSAVVDYPGKILTVAGESLVSDDIVTRVRSLGYELRQFKASDDDAPDTHVKSILDKRRVIAVAAGAAMVASAGVLEWLSVAGWLVIALVLGAALIDGIPIALMGLRALKRRRLDINLLMSVAAVGAFIIGEWLEGGVIIVLFALSELLEDATVARSHRAVEALVKLRPSTALRIKNGSVQEIPVAQLLVGDRLLVKPSSVIPADGRITDGLTSINQATLTGEALPVTKGVEDEVFAGTINGDGSIELEVLRPPGDTTLDRIVKLVRQAQLEKAPLQRFIERFAAYYTPAVFASALLVALVPPLLFSAAWGTWIYRALAMLVIACPCALVISTPVTVVAALTGAARRGVLIKGGAHLEILHRIRAVAFDKTGTVTTGVPVVRQVISLNGLTPDELLTLAARVEFDSEHLVARSIVRAAVERGADLERPTAFTSMPGRGANAVVAGEQVYVGNHALFEELAMCDAAVHERLNAIEGASLTAVLVGSKQKMYGIIAISDHIRPEARPVIENLRSEGVRHVRLITGDNSRSGAVAGEALGVDAVDAELMPQHKVDVTRRLRQQFGGVMVVGDGVNDAPSLAIADVGVAMGGSGIDAALESADVVLAADKLDRLPYLFRLSRRTHRIIVANIAFALATKGLFLFLAAIGAATMWMAVFADTGVAMLVLLNGMRAVRVR